MRSDTLTLSRESQIGHKMRLRHRLLSPQHQYGRARSARTVVGALQTGQCPSIGSVSPNTLASLNSWIFRPQDSDPHHEILKIPRLPRACSGISIATICETRNARAFSAMFSNMSLIACSSRDCISDRFTHSFFLVSLRTRVTEPFERSLGPISNRIGTPCFYHL
jgi:hypothetical protein